MKDIEKRINFFKNQRSRSINTNLGNLGVISEAEKEAKEIYKKFKDGCGEDVDCYGYPNFDGGWECGQQYLNKEIIFCPKCKEIKEIWKKLNSEEDKTCATKHVIPPKHECSGILPIFI